MNYLLDSSEDQLNVCYICCLHETVGIRLPVGIIRLTRQQVNNRTYCGYKLNHAQLACMKHHKIYLEAFMMSGPAVYLKK